MALYGLIVSTALKWIARKFGVDIHGPQRINPNEFGDLPEPRACQIFHLFSDLFQHVLDGFA